MWWLMVKVGGWVSGVSDCVSDKSIGLLSEFCAIELSEINPFMFLLRERWDSGNDRAFLYERPLSLTRQIQYQRRTYRQNDNSSIVFY